MPTTTTSTLSPFDLLTASYDFGYSEEVRQLQELLGIRVDGYYLRYTEAKHLEARDELLYSMTGVPPTTTVRVKPPPTERVGPVALPVGTFLGAHDFNMIGNYGLGRPDTVVQATYIWISGDDSACSIDQGRWGVEIIGVGSCTVLVEMGETVGTPTGPGQIKMTPKYFDLVGVVVELDSDSSGECVDVFRVSESPSSTQESGAFSYALEYEGTEADLGIEQLGCDSISLGTVEFESTDIKVELTITPHGDGLAPHALFWLLNTGEENFVMELRPFSETLSTDVGDVLVIRKSGPQPVATLVDECGTELMFQRWVYVPRVIAGWNVNVSCQLHAEPDTLDRLVGELAEDLHHVVGVAPEGSLPTLQETTFWVELDRNRGSGIAGYYGVGVGLVSQGLPDQFADSIVIDSGRWVLFHETQVSLVFHELSHAWDNKHVSVPLGRSVDDAYEAALGSGIYAEVEHKDHRAGISTKESYAIKNPFEYFAVLSATWFWESEFYPFNREQLLEHDPLGAAAVEAAWNVSP